MLIVQKYGGTSVGDLERIEAVRDRIIKRAEEGNKLIIIVSAMSGETNKLISYANHFSKLPVAKDMDMLLSTGERMTSALLSIALNEKGFKALSMTGRRAGIKTNDSHTYAKIIDINNKNILDKLEDGNIVVVAGFQGVNNDGEVTTLGRGGSDLSAVAIAGAIKADFCEIYTDVDGIYTTDPRIVKRAKKISKISYEEMLELASLGAKVMQNRSIEMAKKLGVNIIVRNSFNNNEGTLITHEEKIVEKPSVSGVVLDKNQARVSMSGVKDRPGIASEIFTALSCDNLNIDMIVQTIGKDGETNIDFTVSQSDLEKTKVVLENFTHDFYAVDYDEYIVKVSIVGSGMRSNSGVASKAFTTLADEGVNIMMISTSEIRVSMIIERKYGELILRELHSAYDLDEKND
jgi:aspartate kinase